MADVFDGVPQDAPSEEEQAIDDRYAQLLNQCVDVKGLRNLPKPEPLIDGWLNKNSLAWLGGKPGSCKSFVAVEMACCIATGEDWHHRLVAKGKVLYLIAEGAEGLSQRVDAWMDCHDYDDIPGAIFLPVPVQMIDSYSVDVAAMAKLIRTIQPVLVIVDTQARVTVGADENSSRDMGKLVDAVELLRRQCLCTILIVHHEPRQGDNLRGSIALEGAASTILRATKEGDLVGLEIRKQKNAAAIDPMSLYLWEWAGSAVLVTDVPESHKRTFTANQQKILDVLMEWPGWEAPATQLLKACDMPSDSTYYRALHPLVNKGKVFKRESGNRVWYSIPEPDRPKPQGV
jgi:hypothetical protein